MRDEDKTKEQLLEELLDLRHDLAEAQQLEGRQQRLDALRRTEQQRASAVLLESEETLRIVAEHINTVFWLMDAVGSRMLYVSPAYESAWGRSCQSLREDVYSFLEAVLPEDRQKATDIFQQQVRDGHVDGEYRLLMADGSVRWTWVRGYSTKNAAGAITRHVGICEDITERKQSELSSSRLAAIVEHSEDAIVSLTLDGVAITWNHGAEQLYGYTAEEMIGHSVSILIPPAGLSEYREIISQVKRKQRIPTFETVRQRKDGRLIDVSMSITPIAIRSGEVNSSSQISRDISRIKQLERQYQQSQKMEAIGRLAGGVAHDFNNLLTVVKGYCVLLLDGLDAGGDSWTMVNEIRIAGERAATLTRQLLAFGRQQVLQPRVLDLNDIVRDMETMLRRLIGEDIIVALDLDPALRQVKADPGQIQQVLMNLAVNARDAMPAGGKLTIETRNVVLDEAFCDLHPGVQPGACSLLAVSDSGTGMDEETKNRMFEPFFTTKDVGKGTGLGMATVLGVIQQSGGYIEVDSEVGRGTTIKTYLRQVSAPIERVTPQPEAVAHSEHHETVLLVEDDDAVRALAKRILISCGYQVLEAANGQAAIDLANRYQGEIDLLASDVIMPHMSGQQLAEELVKLRPGLKVLFLSGYTDDAMIRQGLLTAGFAFLQKPFTSASLSQHVRAVLA